MLCEAQTSGHERKPHSTHNFVGYTVMDGPENTVQHTNNHKTASDTVRINANFVRFT
jgi:hypothetical protein